MKEKKCTKCKEVKSIDQFHAKNKERGTYKSHCKECRSIHRKKRYEENSEHERANSRKWHLDNLEYARAGKREHYENNKEWYTARDQRRRDQELASNDKSATKAFYLYLKTTYTHCCTCGTEFSGEYPEPCSRTIAHIQPLNRGGRTSSDNLLPQCALCNARQGTKTLQEWGVGQLRIDWIYDELKKNGELFNAVGPSSD